MVEQVAFSPNGKLLAAALLDPREIWLWSLEERKTKHTFRSPGPHHTVKFLPNGDLAVMAKSCDTSVRVWDTETGEVKHNMEHCLGPGFEGLMKKVKCSLDGTLAAIELDRDLIEVWNIEKNEKKPISIKPEETQIDAITLSSNGKFMALIYRSGCIRLWNTETGIKQPIFKGDPRNVTHAVFLPDDRVIALANKEEIYLWNRKEEAAKRVYGLDYFPDVIISSLDGKLAEFGSQSDYIRLFNTRQEEETRVLQSPSKYVPSVAFSPNFPLLASVSASADETVRLWNTEDGEELCIFKAYSKRIRHITFSPNGELLATASDEGRVGLWNVSQWMNRKN